MKFLYRTAPLDLRHPLKLRQLVVIKVARGLILYKSMVQLLIIGAKGD